MAEEVDERAVVPVFPPFRVGDVVEARLRGKHHWYPATVCDVEVEGLEMHEWRYTIQYTDGYRDLHYPPPPPPLAERNVEPKYMRDVGEHHALTAVYDQCGGAGDGKNEGGWTRRTGWDREAVAKMQREARPFYEDIENWEGVSCTDGRLSHLLLENNCLTSKLPVLVWRLEYLVELNLANNGLTGGVPPAVSNMRSLTWLDLSGNRIGGRIPRAIGGCGRLQVLDLSRNLFNGPLPTTLGRCLDLRECRLADNDLGGEIPASFASALKFCEDLQMFDVSDNPKLEGFDAFRDSLRQLVPACAIFVGQPALESTGAVQSFEDAVVETRAPHTRTMLMALCS